MEALYATIGTVAFSAAACAASTSKAEHRKSIRGKQAGGGAVDRLWAKGPTKPIVPKGPTGRDAAAQLGLDLSIRGMRPPAAQDAPAMERMKVGAQRMGTRAKTEAQRLKARAITMATRPHKHGQWWHDKEVDPARRQEDAMQPTWAPSNLEQRPTLGIGKGSALTIRELSRFAAVVTPETPEDAARMSGSAYDWLITTTAMAQDDIHGKHFDTVLSDEENLRITDAYPSLASSAVREYVHSQGTNDDSVRSFAVVGWASTYDVVQLRAIGVHADHWLVHVHVEQLADLRRIHRVLGLLVPGEDRRNPKSVTLVVTFGVDADLSAEDFESESENDETDSPSPERWYGNYNDLLAHDARKYVCKVAEQFGAHTKLCISFNLGLMAPENLEMFQARFIFPGKQRSAVGVQDGLVWYDTSANGIALITKDDYADVSDESLAQLREEPRLPTRKDKIQLAARNLMVSRRVSCTNLFRRSLNIGAASARSMAAVVDLLAAQVPEDRFCNVSGFFASACGDVEEEEQEAETFSVHTNTTYASDSDWEGEGGATDQSGDGEEVEDLAGDIMLSTDKFPIPALSGEALRGACISAGAADTPCAAAESLQRRLAQILPPSAGKLGQSYLLACFNAILFSRPLRECIAQYARDELERAGLQDYYTVVRACRAAVMSVEAFSGALAELRSAFRFSSNADFTDRTTKLAIMLAVLDKFGQQAGDAEDEEGPSAMCSQDNATTLRRNNHGHLYTEMLTLAMSAHDQYLASGGWMHDGAVAHTMYGLFAGLTGAPRTSCMRSYDAASFQLGDNRVVLHKFGGDDELAFDGGGMRARAVEAKRAVRGAWKRIVKGGINHEGDGNIPGPGIFAEAGESGEIGDAGTTPLQEAEMEVEDESRKLYEKLLMALQTGVNHHSTVGVRPVGMFGKAGVNAVACVTAQWEDADTEEQDLQGVRGVCGQEGDDRRLWVMDDEYGICDLASWLVRNQDIEQQVGLTVLGAAENAQDGGAYSSGDDVTDSSSWVASNQRVGNKELYYDSDTMDMEWREVADDLADGPANDTAVSELDTLSVTLSDTTDGFSEEAGDTEPEVASVEDASDKYADALETLTLLAYLEALSA